MDEASRIAAKLSAAQVEAVTWPSQCTPIMIWSYDKTIRVLERYGLIASRRSGWATLSELGLAVREHLMEIQS